MTDQDSTAIVPATSDALAPLATPNVELEATFDDASLEMNTAGDKFRVSQAVQNLINDTAAGLASHRGVGGAAHAVATPSVAGFMSASDKIKLDAAPAAGSGSGGVWTPPAAAHALNDEFTSAVLDPAWQTYLTPYGGTMAPKAFDFATPINIFNPPLRADMVARASLARRPSWLQIQPGAVEWGGGWQGEYAVIKPIGVVPASMAFWARITVNWIPQVSKCGFRLYGGAPGSPTLTDTLQIDLSIANTPPAYQVVYGGSNGGTFTNTLAYTNQSFGNGPLASVFVGIQKVNSDYWAFFGGDTGSSTLMPNKWSTAATFTHIGFYCQGYGAAAEEGKGVYSIDFVRFANGVALPL